MTLKNLVSNVLVQGNIRISEWKDSEEIYVYEFEYEDNLIATLNSKNLRHLLKKHIKFLFTPDDGYLHIELTDENEI